MTTFSKKLSSRIRSRDFSYIVFDLDGTLYSSTAGLEFKIPKAVRKSLVKHMGRDEEFILNSLKEARYGSPNIFKYMQDKNGFDTNDILTEAYNSLDLATIKIYPNLPKHLSMLSGYFPLCVATNSHMVHAERVLEHIKIRNLFTKIVTPYEDLVPLKPNYRYFEMMLKALNCTAADILFFDDSYHNVNTATNIGISSVLVSNGLAKKPYFWEMHSRKVFEAPPYIDGATYDISDSLWQMIKMIEE